MFTEQEQKTEDLDGDDGSFERKGSTTTKLLLIGSLGIILGYLSLELLPQLQSKKGTTEEQKQKILQQKQIVGGEWQLYNTEGKQFGSDDLKGYYYIIYFGFCKCPDICPNALQKISQSIRKVQDTPEGRLIKLKSIFVSVDPDRDTMSDIKKFCNLFDKNIIGVTGSSNNDQKLKDIMKKFRIYSTKIEYELAEDNRGKDKLGQLQYNYTIDHTVISYLMDDEGQYLIHLGPNLNENQLSRIIIDKILENEISKINQ
ncbi:sco1 family protein, putative [Ichthyophthirius multifiliis]|uniref:Sco1 family protein, putative n=1 Tax=Ichthyophthirius multifiliis TaxID=5932 RepID=G0QX18_ICHMU|nr:sco1 family protein, putative [Ichthyophthirius multifiliis]EGR30241.1 sco1 family protein, putative [Ichthyophthirius multifiliis]|eukprot:XP_004031837.1 sco1 family protein, putative [Ichthyophthirius multifiliis]